MFTLEEAKVKMLQVYIDWKVDNPLNKVLEYRFFQAQSEYKRLKGEKL